MLKNVISPKNRIDHETFDRKIAPLRERLGVLQRSLRDAHIPVVIVMEGWDAAGITRSTKMVIQSLDPRGFTLHTIEQPTDNERMRPFMWRFWIRMPPKGRIAIFARLVQQGDLRRDAETQLDQVPQGADHRDEQFRAPACR